MQVIKRVTIPEGDGDTYDRPEAYPDLSLNRNLSFETNYWNTEIATFLSECGVDAYYGVRDGYTDKEWLWIHGIPWFMAVTTQGIIRARSLTSTNAISLSTTPVRSYIFSFVGNPSKTFIFRIFETDLTMVFAVRFDYALTPYGLRLPALQMMSNNKSIVHALQVLYAIDESSKNAISINFSNPFFDLNSSYYETLIGDRFLLTPIYSSVATLAPILVIDGVYRIPTNLNQELDTPDSTSLYQLEIEISGKKFLVGTNKSETGFGSGLIALDDDDPLISEEELMRGVES